MTSEGNSALLPANVDQPLPLQRGLMNFQLQNFQLYNKSLKSRDCKYQESLARPKKSKILIICQKKPFWGTIFQKNIFDFQKSIVLEKM